MSNANSISKYESDICYSKWQEIIGYLTNKSDLKFNIKEQFFRHFYMSFKNDLEEEILENNPDWKGHLKKEINSSNLMSAYTILCDNLGYNILMNKLSKAAYYYSVVMYPYEKPDIIDSFKNKKYYGLLCLLKSLKVKQSYLLIPYILMEQERLELTDEDIAEIIRLVIVFFVWRNVLDSPAPRFFKSAILNFNIFVKNCFRGKELVDMLRKNFIEQFTLAHITTQMFIGGLHKPLYNGPTNTVSAILRTIEYYYSTRETDKHIWDNDWSIEHVFPQERPVSPVWVKEIANGDIAKANHLAMTKCHCLGNLTLTKYNSNLSTKSFIEKRDRKDNANGNGNYIGAWDANNNTFTSLYSSSLLVKDIDMYAFAKAYPNYKFKITINEGQTTEYVANKIHVSFNDTRINGLASEVDGLDIAIVNSVYSTFVEFETGYWGVADGLPSPSLYWARSTGYVPKSIIATVPNKYAIVLLAYDNNGAYVGTWDSNSRTFTKTYDYSLLSQVTNIADVSVQYPSYRYKISINDGHGMDIDDLTEVININDASLANQINRIVPAYYINHMETKTASIRDNINAVGKNGETFVFITDIHWENNYRNSPSLIENILDNTNVRLLLCGGDLINTATKATAENLIQSCVKAFDFSTYPMHTAFGNHDANSLNWSTVEEQTANEFSANEVFGLTQKNASFANNYITDNGINFYFDRGDSKTRFIFLDSGTDSTYSSGTIHALCNTLNSTPSGYKIVIVQHWYFNGVTPQTAILTTTAQVLMDIVKQYNDRGSYTYSGETYSFASAVGDVFLLLGGHTHYDYVLDADDANNTAGVPLVCTADDSWRDRTITSGTITEQCFDVITLDYDNRVIKCVRIGDGSDRTISY